jgi:hypothetical protein
MISHDLTCGFKKRWPEKNIKHRDLTRTLFWDRNRR